MDPKQLRLKRSQRGRAPEARPVALPSFLCQPSHALPRSYPGRSGPHSPACGPRGSRAARASEEPKKAGAWCARERRGALALLFLVCLEPRI